MPAHVVVHKTFGRVLVPWEPPKTKGADRKVAIEDDLRAQNYPFKRTISFLEIAYWSEPINLAIHVKDAGTAINEINQLAWSVRYLGKRASFVQLLGSQSRDDAAVSGDAAFARRIDLMSTGDRWPARFIQRPADDLSPGAEFDRVSVATTKKVRTGGLADIDKSAKIDRFVGLPFLLPLHLLRSGRSFAHYARADQGE